MSARREQEPSPRDVKTMIAWLQRNPDEPFFFTQTAAAFLCGFRNDEGELHAFRCTVLDEGWTMDKRRTKGARR